MIKPYHAAVVHASGTKEQVAIRLDRDVLSAFRSSGPGWQTRMNEVLRDWLRTHSAV